MDIKSANFHPLQIFIATATTCMLFNLFTDTIFIESPKIISSHYTDCILLNFCNPDLGDHTWLANAMFKELHKLEEI